MLFSNDDASENRVELIFPPFSYFCQVLFHNNNAKATNIVMLNQDSKSLNLVCFLEPSYVVEIFTRVYIYYIGIFTHGYTML